MLRSLNEIRGYRLAAQDGAIGSCKDFLFDDLRWAVRYMVADTRKWLPGRKVLIMPAFLGEPQWRDRLLPVNLTKEAIRDAPALAEDAPVSLQEEMNYLRHYGFPFYWQGGALWGPAPTPHGMAPAAGELLDRAQDPAADQGVDHHLRSAKEVEGYSVAAEDETFGHVEDFILDDVTWHLPYAVVDTQDWLPGKKVLIATEWIADVDWVGRKISVSLSEESIRQSPEYDPGVPINRAYEERLYDFYGRPYPR